MTRSRFVVVCRFHCATSSAAEQKVLDRRGFREQYGSLLCLLMSSSGNTAPVSVLTTWLSVLFVLIGLGISYWCRLHRIWLAGMSSASSSRQVAWRFATTNKDPVDSFLGKAEVQLATVSVTKNVPPSRNHAEDHWDERNNGGFTSTALAQ